MNEIAKNGRQYVGYNYKTIYVPSSKASMMLDYYQNFGWELASDFYTQDYDTPPIKITLKQDKKLINRMEITRLQNHFESCMEEIKNLENSIDSLAVAVSIAVGIIGAAFIAGAVLTILNNPSHHFLIILFSLIGITIAILPIFIYKRLYLEKAKTITPLIEEKYNEVDKICEKAYKLINIV
jgi:hypothetical protein